ncbi:MAG: hypothetical protein KBH12_09115 [Synergistaceae bacterium]|nr:hypothetical protein [Synergistaceae bacterium]
MEIALVSLIALVIAIAMGFWTKINLGIISIAFAFIVGHFLVGMDSAVIYTDGWPIRLFFMLLGMTLLFGIAKINGTFTVIAKQIAFFSYGSRKLMCLIIYVFCAVVSMVGVGSIVTPAILLPLIIEIAREEDLPENLVILLCIAGSIAGGLSTLAPTGIIGNDLTQAIGLKSYTPIFIMSLFTFSLHGVIFFFVFGGLKLKKAPAKPRQPMNLDRKQLLTLGVIGVVIFSILGYKFDLGLTAFAGAALLLVFRAADQDEAVANVAWSTLLLICGVSVLVNVIKVSGGIDLMAEYLTKAMNPVSASAIMAMLAGVLSSVSSASGVVMPTLIPTIPGILKELGISGNILIMSAAVIIGAHVVPYSPLSTMGAMGMAAASERSNKQRLFTELLLVAAVLLFFTSLLFFVGVYNIF